MRIIIFLLLIFFLIKPACAQWTGSVNLFEKFTGTGTFAGWMSEKHIDLSFTDAVPTLGRNIQTTNFQFTDDKGTGTIKDHTESTISGPCNCSGVGTAQLYEVGFHPDNTYRIY